MHVMLTITIKIAQHHYWDVVTKLTKDRPESLAISAVNVVHSLGYRKVTLDDHA